MSQHVPELGYESNGDWLPITEYSVKSGMSLSTIRRKIKSNSLAYRLDRGKYLIFFGDKELGDSPPKPTPMTKAPVAKVTESTGEKATLSRASHSEKVEKISRFSSEEEAFHMVSDAYEHALKEKDERIKLLEEKNRDLEDRLNELRLLVQVLEEKYEVRY